MDNFLERHFDKIFAFVIGVGLLCVLIAVAIAVYKDSNHTTVSGVVVWRWTQGLTSYVTIRLPSGEERVFRVDPEKYGIARMDRTCDFKVTGSDKVVGVQCRDGE